MGGNFAAMIAQAHRKTKAPVLQLLIYPGLDFVSETPSMHDFADAFPLTAETVDFFVKHYLPDDADPSDPRLSPGRTQDLRGLAPALIYTAGFDMLLDQGEAYAQAAGGGGREGRLQALRYAAARLRRVSDGRAAAEAAIRQIARETAAALKGQL